MATATYGIVRQFTRQSTTSTTFVDVSGANIAAANLSAGKKYLLLVTGLADSSTINEVARLRVVHGSTAFDDSSWADEPEVALTSRMGYHWFGVWTAVAGEDVKLQLCAGTGLAGTDTVGVTHVVMFWLKLSDDFTENADWYLNENATSTTLSISDSTANNASVSFTPPVGTDWMVLSSARHTAPTANISYRSKLVATGTYASSLPQAVQEGESPTDGVFLHTLARVYPALAASTQTFTEVSKLDQAGAGTEARTHSKVFALNLAKFRNVARIYTEAELDLSATDFATTVQTLPFTPEIAGDALVVGWWAFDPTATGIYAKARLQVDNADTTSGQTTDALTQAESHDPADIIPVFQIDVVNLTTAAHTVDQDGSCEAAIAGRGANYRTLVVISMELPAAPPPVAVGGLGLTFKPTRHQRPMTRRWEWLRRHAVGAWLMWERGYGELFNLVSGRRAPIVFGAGGRWNDRRTGPSLTLAGAGYVDTGQPRIGSVGLFAAAAERWTLVARVRVAASAVGNVVARAGGIAGDRTCQLVFDRPANAAHTPAITLRGTSNATSWGLDDGSVHTIWITWDGAAAIAYYDDAKGALTLTVGAAVEETAETIIFGGRTTAAPTGLLAGDLDLVAILDVALDPGAIAQWHRDLYDPWRPIPTHRPRSVQPPPPAPIDPGPIVYAQPVGLDRLELWTDVEANGGTRIGIVNHWLGLSERVSHQTGEHTVTLGVPLNHPLITFHDQGELDHLRVDQVVRMVKADGTWSEHRINEAIRKNQRGARTLAITARSIFQDLGFRGMVSRTEADGSSTVGFEARSLPMQLHLEHFVMPAAAEAGAPFWRIGQMAHVHPVDMVYEGDTPLSALWKLVEAGGAASGRGLLEVGYEAGPTGYTLNIVERVGQEVDTLVVRARQNLADLELALRADDQATRVYAVGAQNPDGSAPTPAIGQWDVVSVTPAGLNLIDIRLADPAGGEGPIRFDGQFLPPAISIDDPSTETQEAPSRYFLQYTSAGDFLAPIMETFAGTQTVRVQSSVPASGAGFVGTPRARIVADAALRGLLFVEHPDMVRQPEGYGVRVMKVVRQDVPATDNLIPNPRGRIWPAGSVLPTLWSKFEPNNTPNPLVITRETDARYWKDGGSAMRVRWPVGGTYFDAFGPRITSPVARIPHRAQGYLSYFVEVTTLKGRVHVVLELARPVVDWTGAATPTFAIGSGTRQYAIPVNTGLTPDDPVVPAVESKLLNTSEKIGIQAALDLGKYPMYGGAATISIYALTEVETECLIHMVQLTNSHQQMPSLEGNGGVKLHQAANGQLGRYATPAPSVSVNLIDLAELGGLRFPYDPLTRGGRIQIQDPDSGILIETRMVGWTRDWHNRTLPNVDLSNERHDISTLLATRPRAARHESVTTPFGTRGLATT